MERQAAVLRASIARANMEVPSLSLHVRMGYSRHSFGTKAVPRFLVVRGFHVHYYVDTMQKKVVGHFDLRNVVSMRYVNDGEAVDAAVELCIVEVTGIDRVAKKEVLLAIYNTEERLRLLEYFASAVDEAAIEEEIEFFGTYINEDFSESLDSTCAEQDGVSSRRRRFRKRAGSVPVVSKRSSITANLAPMATARKSLGSAPPRDKLAWESTYHKPSAAEDALGNSSLEPVALPSPTRRASTFVGAPPGGPTRIIVLRDDELVVDTTDDMPFELEEMIQPALETLHAKGANPTRSSLLQLIQEAAETASVRTRWSRVRELMPSLRRTDVPPQDHDSSYSSDTVLESPVQAATSGTSTSRPRSMSRLPQTRTGRNSLTVLATGGARLGAIGPSAATSTLEQRMPGLYEAKKKDTVRRRSSIRTARQLATDGLTNAEDEAKAKEQRQKLDLVAHMLNANVSVGDAVVPLEMPVLVKRDLRV